MVRIKSALSNELFIFYCGFGSHTQSFRSTTKKERLKKNEKRKEMGSFERGFSILWSIILYSFLLLLQHSIKQETFAKAVSPFAMTE